MRINVLFQFKKDAEPVAFTGIEDGVTDLLLPTQGDLVSHTDVRGNPFTGKVSERMFAYDLPAGDDVHGTITVTLFLDTLTLH